MTNSTIKVVTEQAAPLGSALHMNGDYGLTQTQSFYDEGRQIVMLEYLAEMFDCDVVNEIGQPLKITLTQKRVAAREKPRTDHYDGRDHEYCEQCGDCVFCDVPHECALAAREER